MIHKVKDFTIVNKAEVDIFMKLSFFSFDPKDVGDLICVCVCVCVCVYTYLLYPSIDRHYIAECQKIDASELWCWRRLLRVPWTARKSNQSILKEISPGCSLEGLMLKLKLQYFGHLMWKVDSLEKTLMLGGIGGRRRRGLQRKRWLDGITDLLEWVWVNSGSWWWTGRPGVLQFMRSQRVGNNWVTEQNWTELNWGCFHLLLLWIKLQCIYLFKLVFMFSLEKLFLCFKVLK